MEPSAKTFNEMEFSSIQIRMDSETSYWSKLINKNRGTHWIDVVVSLYFCVQSNRAIGQWVCIRAAFMNTQFLLITDNNTDKLQAHICLL